MMETNLRGEMTVAVDESQFSLKDNEFIRAIAATLRAGSAEVRNLWYLSFLRLKLRRGVWVGRERNASPDSPDFNSESGFKSV